MLQCVAVCCSVLQCVASQRVAFDILSRKSAGKRFQKSPQTFYTVNKAARGLLGIFTWQY